MNFDPAYICIDKFAVSNRSNVFEPLADSVSDDGFDLGGGDASPAPPLNFMAQSGAWTVSSEKFGQNVRNGVDVYTPAGASNAPVVVFFYGGNWQSGDKASYRFKNPV